MLAFSGPILELPPTKKCDEHKKAVDQPKMSRTAKKRKHCSLGKGISVFSGQIYVIYS